MNPEPDIKSEEKITPAQTEVESQETPQEINWKNFRDQREQERKGREAAEKMASEERAKAEALKAAMESLLNKPQAQSSDPQDESEEKRIARQVEAIISQREASTRLEREKQEQQDMPQTLQKQFPDFHQVVKSQNLDYLEFHYPEVAEPFRHMPDNLAKWQAMYKAVKRFVPNVDPQKDSRKADNNMNKPQGSPTSVSPSGSSSGPSIRLDEQRRAQNWERMQKVMKGLS